MQQQIHFKLTDHSLSIMILFDNQCRCSIVITTDITAGCFGVVTKVKVLHPNSHAYVKSPYCRVVVAFAAESAGTGKWPVFFSCECCILRNLLSRTISSEGATHSQAQWDLFSYKLKLRVLNRERKCTQFICLLASDRFISRHVRNDDKILWCWNKIWTGSLDGSWMIM